MAFVCYHWLTNVVEEITFISIESVLNNNDLHTDMGKTVHNVNTMSALKTMLCKRAFTRPPLVYNLAVIFSTMVCIV